MNVLKNISDNMSQVNTVKLNSVLSMSIIYIYIIDIYYL